jgi:PAS domain S-box-containing protein
MCWASFHATHYLPPSASAPAGVQIDARWVVLTVALVTSLILAAILLAINLDHRLQRAIAASASVLRAANSQLEQRVADRTHQLSQEEARTRAIIATAQDCIISFDAAGVVTEFNPAAEKEFGLQRAQAIGQSIVELIVPAPQRDNVRQLLQDYAGGRGHIALNEPREGEMQRCNGSRFPAEFTIARIMLGNELFFTMFLRDITVRRAAQTALCTAKEAAEAASEAKTTFLATMSHEIRTPMNALLGLQELLSLSRLDEDQRETLRLLRQSSKSLLRLIDDILDFSKIEAGKLEIGSEPTLIRSLLEDLCATFSAVGREKGLKLACEIEPAVPPVVMADALRVRQILGNLLSNAIKFTSRGEVTILTAFQLDAHGKGVMEFHIHDHGIGMSEAVLARCGEPFQQADASTARRYGGSGLGLAICRRLAALMHGTFEVRSQLNVGTQVTVRLPLEPVAASTEPFEPDITQGLVLSMPSRAPSVEDAAQSRQLILVVDDHPTNRHLLVQQLEWLGYACEACANGHSALERYQARLRDGNPYALTITDCQMPEMDGYELARQIRRSEAGTLRKTVLIAFTANTMRGVSELCESCGFNDLLTKPINLATLKAKLDRWLPLPQGRALVVPAVVETPTVSLTTQVTLTAELQAEFCSAHQEDLNLLGQGIEMRDVLAISRGAHRIRGAARMVGAHGVDQAATHLQRAARAENWRQIKEALGLLRIETRLLFAQFQCPTE